MSGDRLKQFVSASTATEFKLDLKLPKTVSYTPLENDALFHLPFIAMSILALCKDKKYVPTSGSVGRIIGEVFERTFPAFKSSNQMLSWSANLRAKTARALVFLEQSNLVLNVKSEIHLTDEGRKLINSVHSESSSLGLAVRGVCRNYRDMSEENNLTLG